jgi:hypothetical protein
MSEPNLETLLGAASAMRSDLPSTTRDAVLAELLDNPGPAVAAPLASVVPLASRRRRTVVVAVAIAAAVATAAGLLAAVLPSPDARRGAPVAQPLSADADAGMAPGAPVVGPGGAVAVPRDRRLGPATVGTAGPVSTPPTIVPPTTLEELRIQGDKQILPDDATRLEIAEAGVRRLVIPFRLCVDVDGAVSEVALLKASGFPAYDAKLADAMWLWRYQPYQIDGAAVPVCAVVQFQYSQR